MKGNNPISPNLIGDSSDPQCYRLSVSVSSTNTGIDRQDEYFRRRCDSFPLSPLKHESIPTDLSQKSYPFVLVEQRVKIH
jgi:hypothetical protein